MQDAADDERGSQTDEPGEKNSGEAERRPWGALPPEVPDEAARGWLTLQRSGAPLEKEYRTVCEAMARCGVSTTSFDAKSYDKRAVEQARDMWHFRMEVEHRSTSVFSALCAQLMEANAGLDAKVVMLRMAQDELRHTETCGNVVRAMGAEPERVVPLGVTPLAVHKGCTPEERALRNVIYTTCLSEMIAVARFVESLDTMSDPFLRDQTRLLLSDEILHGQFGFHYLESWRPWLERHPETLAGVTKYLTHAFVILEEALAGPRPSPHDTLTDDERALGLPDPQTQRDVFYGTIEQAVVPGLDRFGIDATKAWATRRRLA